MHSPLTAGLLPYGLDHRIADTAPIAARRTRRVGRSLAAGHCLVRQRRDPEEMARLKVGRVGGQQEHRQPCTRLAMNSRMAWETWVFRRSQTSTMGVGLIQPHHNGRTEGVNTRTKRIMRQMHGRVGALRQHFLLQ